MKNYLLYLTTTVFCGSYIQKKFFLILCEFKSVNGPGKKKRLTRSFYMWTHTGYHRDYYLQVEI